MRYTWELTLGEGEPTKHYANGPDYVSRESAASELIAALDRHYPDLWERNQAGQFILIGKHFVVLAMVLTKPTNDERALNEFRSRLSTTLAGLGKLEDASLFDDLEHTRTQLNAALAAVELAIVRAHKRDVRPAVVRVGDA